MNTKLTLTIEQKIIKKAKKYAKGEGRSLSKIIENYLQSVTTNQNGNEFELPPIVKSLKGTFTAPNDFNYKSELGKRLEEKYLK
jgi:hypothetical protein